MTNIKLLQIDITDECPLYCLHCSNSSGPNKKQYISLLDIERLLIQASDLTISNFVISGGEPLRHPEIDQVIKASHRLGFASTIFTTGIRDTRKREPVTPSDWEKYRDSGLSAAVFSIYSSPSDCDFHNHIVQLRPIGLRDAFSVNQTAIENAISAGIHTELQFIPSERTSSQLAEIFDWCIALGCIRLHLQYPTIQGRNQISQALVMTTEREAHLRSEALRLLNVSSQQFHVSRLWQSKWGLSNVDAHPKQIIVKSDGTAVPCNACKYLGSTIDRQTIYEKSLEEICKDNFWRCSNCDCTEYERDSRQAFSAGKSSDVHVMPTHELLPASIK